MNNQWKNVTLGEVAKCRNGAGIKQEFFSNFGVPLVRVSDFTANSIHLQNCLYIDETHAKSWSNHRLKAGDIIIATVGSWPPNWSSVVGKVVRVPIEVSGAIQNQNTVCVLANKNVACQLFLYFLLKSREFLYYAANTAYGSANQARLAVANLEKFSFKLPSLSEQQAIAHILGSLDDKIELNRQMNETLEGIARALFKSWFVDFDPVRAKMEGRQPYGMDAETAALFPDGFEDSKLGEIPISWEVVKLSRVAAVNEISLTKDFPYEEIEYIDISSVSTGKLVGTSRYASSMAPSRAKRIVRHGDTIWSTVRPNRKSYLFIHTPLDNLVVSTGFAVLTPKSVPPTYLYAWVTTDRFIEYLMYNADGSAYPAVLPGRFSDATTLLPSLPILQKFENLISHMRSLIFRNDEEAQTLATLRDTLLPKLLSGAIRVKDAEKVVGSVL